MNATNTVTYWQNNHTVTTNQTLTTGWVLSKEQEIFAHVNNIIYYSILFPVAICGNVFTLTAVVMVLRMKPSIPNLLIGVLATNDLLSLLSCHGLSISSMVRGQWAGNDEWCHFQSVMAFSYFKMGFFTKCNISLDRFIALAFPLRYQTLVSLKKMVFVVLLNVLFAILTSALTPIFDPQYIHRLSTWYLCIDNFEYYTTYKLAVVSIEGAIFFIGVVLFLTSNITVIKVALQLNKKTHEMTTLGKFSDQVATEDNNVPLEGLPLEGLVEISKDHGSCIIEASSVNKKIPDHENNDAQQLSASHTLTVATPQVTAIVHQHSGSPNSCSSRQSAKRHYDNPSVAEAQTNRKNTNGFMNIANPEAEQIYLATEKELEMNKPLEALKFEGDEMRGRTLSSSTTSSSSTLYKLTKADKLRLYMASEGTRQALTAAADKMHQRRRKSSHLRRELHFAKLVVIIVTVFVILWTPYMCVIYYEHHTGTSLHPLVEDIAIKLVFANACINPILYGVFNASFRKAYWFYIRMLCFYLTCKLTKRPQGQVYI